MNTIHKGKSKVASNEIRKKIYIDFHVYKKNNKFWSISLKHYIGRKSVISDDSYGQIIFDAFYKITKR